MALNDRACGIINKYALMVEITFIARKAEPTHMEWKIPQIEDEPLIISLESGSPLFVVGPNGSGKSALIQHAVSTLGTANVRRISAHRQMWLNSSSINLTPHSRRQFDQQLNKGEPNPVYRYLERDAGTRIASVLFDLTVKENDLARRIMNLAFSGDEEDIKKITEAERPVFDKLNDLLRVGRLAVTIRNSAGEQILAQHRDVSEPYGMEQMSDGERSAVLLAASVLTAKSGTVLLIDEPERHLHRSIIEPFLTGLFEQRKDCPFVISTHEPALPLANSNSDVLIVRSCQWNGATATAWDVSLLENDAGLPEDVKRAILGSRRKILFVEGKAYSLDIQLYEALFPDISIRPVDSCEDVIKVVRGLRDSQQHHDVEAFGLIDGDNRNAEEVARLKEQGIHALNECSVESLYYCSDAMTAVSNWQAIGLGEDPAEMLETAKTGVLATLGQAGLAERLAARRCERIVRAKYQSMLPNWKSIVDRSDHPISVDSEEPYNEELRRFRELLETKDIEKLIARYPVRESDAIDRIAGAFDLSREKYEKTLLERVKTDTRLAEKIRQRIGPLSLILE